VPSPAEALVAAGIAFMALVVAVRSKRDAVALLTLFITLLLLLSARLVLPGVGGVGTPANVVALGLLAWWLAGVLAPSLGLVRGSQPVRLGVLLYVGWSLVAYSLAYLRPLTDLEVSGADRSLIRLAALAGIALIAADGIRSLGRLHVLLKRLAALAAVVALIGIVQFQFSYDLSQFLRPPGLVQNFEINATTTRSIFTRPYSTALHPIEFSVVMATIFPITLHYALTYKRPGAGLLVRWAAVTLTAVATLMTVSRSGILGIAVGVGVLWLSWGWRRKLNALVLAVIFLGLMRAAIPGLIGTLRNLFLNYENDPSIQARVDDIVSVERLISARPWTGYGPGTWNNDDDILLDNEYYRTILESGLVGVLLLFLLPLVAFFCARRVGRQCPDADVRHLARAVSASLLVAMVSMATFDSGAYPMFTGVLFLLVGIAGALWRLAPRTGPLADHRENSAATRRTSGLAAEPTLATAGTANRSDGAGQR
jgi:hypothetical protein